MFDWLNTNTEQENETQRGQAPFGSCFEECQGSLAKDSSEAAQWVEMGRWFFFTSVVLTPDSHPQGNYVLDRDELVEAQKPEYDVVLCLSLVSTFYFWKFGNCCWDLRNYTAYLLVKIKKVATKYVYINSY